MDITWTYPLSKSTAAAGAPAAHPRVPMNLYWTIDMFFSAQTGGPIGHVKAVPGRMLRLTVLAGNHGLDSDKDGQSVPNVKGAIGEACLQQRTHAKRTPG